MVLLYAVVQYSDAPAEVTVQTHLDSIMCSLKQGTVIVFHRFLNYPGTSTRVATPTPCHCCCCSP